jgi:hypothetical protein
MVAESAEMHSAGGGAVDTNKKSVDGKKKDDEKIFTAGLIFPTLLALGYAYFLYKTEQEMKADFEAGKEPVREAWFCLPIGFSLAYLAMVSFGPRFMKDREELKIKPYIFVYNLYQCLMNIWTVVSVIQEVTSNPIFTGILGNRPTTGPATFRISFLGHYNNKFVVGYSMDGAAKEE